MMFEIWEDPQWVQTFYAITDVLSYVLVIVLLAVIVIIAVYSLWEKWSNNSSGKKHISVQAPLTKEKRSIGLFTKVLVGVFLIGVLGVSITGLAALRAEKQFSGSEYNNLYAIPEIDWQTGNEKIVFDKEDFSEFVNESIGFSNVDVPLHQRYIYDALTKEANQDEWNGVYFTAFDENKKEDVQGFFSFTEDNLMLVILADDGETEKEIVFIPTN